MVGGKYKLSLVQISLSLDERGCHEVTGEGTKLHLSFML